MKLSFRQGVVSYPQSGNVQQFLQLNSGVVDLRTTNGPTSVTFAHRDTDYFFSEGTDVAGAWGPFAATPVWLYWDLDRQTGLRSFGHTELEPVSGPTAPTSPANDQHWFDTLNGIMKVYSNGAFIERIRVFAAMFDGASFSFLGNNIRLPFAGTQVGLDNLTSLAGTVLFDDDGQPVVKSSNGTFYTTETEFFNGSTRITGIRLESDVVTAVLNQVVPEYHIVRFRTDGRVELAEYNDAADAAIGIATQSGIINDLVNVVVQGQITNPTWNWPTTQIGAPLFIELNGELTLTDPHISQPGVFTQARPPVGRVFGPQQIVFMQGLGGVGPQGPAGDVNNLPDATDTVKGVSLLSVPADIATLPIVVGTNDPRLDGAPFTPLTHLTDSDAHTANNITVTPVGNIVATEVQTALQDLDTLVQNITSGFDPKESVRVATVADIGATYSAVGGTGGSGSFTGAPVAIDGITLNPTDRVLVKDQADPLQNGIYTVLGAGNWERSTDHDGTPAQEVTGGNFTFVEQGTVNISTGWVVDGDGIQVLNSDPINWIKFAGGFVTIDHLTNTDAHTAANITNVPAAAAAVFNNPVPGADVIATTTQGAVDELLTEKALARPHYALEVDRPDPTTSEGMFVWVNDTQKPYVSDGVVWQELVMGNFNIPYDLTYFIGGPTTVNSAISGSHILARDITILATAPGSQAFANTPPVANTSFDIVQIPVGGGAGTNIGTVDFTAGLNVGTVTIAAQVDLVIGEQLQVVNPALVDANIEDITVTVVGCAAAAPCDIPVVLAPTLTVNGFVDEVNGPIFDFQDVGLFTFGGGAITSYTWRITNYNTSTGDTTPPAFPGTWEVTGAGSTPTAGLRFDPFGNESGPTDVQNDVATYVGENPLNDSNPEELPFTGSGNWFRLELTVTGPGGSDTGIVFFHPASI